MKLAVFTLALAGLLVSPTLVSAQDAAREGGRRGPRTPEEQVKALKESLNLTEEQTEKVKAIVARNQEKLQALRQDQNVSQEDRRAKMREITQSMEEDLKPILTPEQLAKWKEERQRRRGGQRGGNQ